MNGQLHITHSADYLRGKQDGRADVQADRDYRPRGGAVGTEDQQRAYGLGYEAGWQEGNPCTNGRCYHVAQCPGSLRCGTGGLRWVLPGPSGEARNVR